MKTKIFHWLTAKPTEKQTRLYKALSTAMMLSGGTMFLAIGIMAFRCTGLLYNSQDIEQVREAIAWGMLASLATPVGAYIAGTGLVEVWGGYYHYFKKAGKKTLT